MRKYVFLRAAAIACAAIAATTPIRAQDSAGVRERDRVASPTTDPGVTIGGVVWATRNVSEPGRFVARPQDRGGYFNFEQARTACPPGWRVPTIDEFESLRNATGAWAALYMTYGRFFFGDAAESNPGTDTAAPGNGGDNSLGNRIFLPAAGFRGSDGRTAYRGRMGTYQSGSPTEAVGSSGGAADYDNYGLFFDTRTVSRSAMRAYGGLRCVAGSPDELPPLPDHDGSRKFQTSSK